MWRQKKKGGQGEREMKAAIYDRVSTSKQEHEQTIESQLERLRSILKKRGWK